MNIWAFLFYTVVLRTISSAVGQSAQNNDNKAMFTLFVLEIVFIALFIYMGWYQ